MDNLNSMFSIKSLSKMTWVEAKLFLREPVGAFFTLAFPLIMLFIFGAIYSNVPAGPGSPGPDAIGTLIPTFMAMVIGITGLMAVTITMATYRENGILRRLRTTPVSPLAVMAAQVAVVFSMTALGTLLLVAAGALFYHARFEGSPLSLLGGFVLGCLSFFGIGFILAGRPLSPPAPLSPTQGERGAKSEPKARLISPFLFREGGRGVRYL